MGSAVMNIKVKLFNCWWILQSTITPKNKKLDILGKAVDDAERILKSKNLVYPIHVHIDYGRGSHLMIPGMFDRSSLSRSNQAEIYVYSHYIGSSRFTGLHNNLVKTILHEFGHLIYDTGFGIWRLELDKPQLQCFELGKKISDLSIDKESFCEDFASYLMEESVGASFESQMKDIITIFNEISQQLRSLSK